MQVNSFQIKSPVCGKYNRLEYLFPLRLVASMKKENLVNGRIFENPLVYRFLKTDAEIILDVGSYTSAVALSLASLGFNVTAIDLRGYPFQHSNLTVVQGDFLANKFKENMFDAVTCISTLEHVPPQEQKRFMQEINRVLRRDGQCLLSVPLRVAKGDAISQEKMREILENFRVEKELFFCRIQSFFIPVDKAERLGTIVAFYDLRCMP